MSDVADNIGNSESPWTTCDATRPNGQKCRVKVRVGDGPCFWHAKTFKQKVKSWARNQTLLFALTVIGAVGTLIGVVAFVGWTYDEFLKPIRPTPPVLTQKGFMQIGQMWFTPPKLAAGNLGLSVWIKNAGEAPVENMVFFVSASVAPVPQDMNLAAQDNKIHAEGKAGALKFNDAQIDQGKEGKTLGKGAGAWQTMTFNLTEEQANDILQGHRRIFLYVWARWRDAPHDLDSCSYLQRPTNTDLNHDNLIWHFCGE